MSAHAIFIDVLEIEFSDLVSVKISSISYVSCVDEYNVGKKGHCLYMRTKVCSR